jgi:processive 1,2-diacylglycerol beta-glucosyltransferase
MPRSQRVLILSASVGAGHVAAGRALEEACRQNPGVAEVQHQDALELTSDVFTRIYADGFKSMVQNTPHFLGFWYDATDEPSALNEGRRLMDRLAASRLVDLVRRENPDVVVCTHFMPAGVVSGLARSGWIDSRLVVVTTDYDYQWAWSVPFVHRIAVALPETEFFLTSCGIPDHNVRVTGIPVSLDFEPAESRLRPGETGRPVVLVSAGAAGEGPLPQVIEQLLRVRLPARFVVVCGRNEQLRQEVVSASSTQAERFEVIGYTDQMPELMRRSDVFIGKPGGLTSAECMAAGLPMIIIKPTPGQEERNADHLLECHGALRCNEVLTLPFKLEGLLGCPQRLARMKKAARRFGRPSAARDTCAAILDDGVAPFSLTRQARRAIYELLRNQ